MVVDLRSDTVTRPTEAMRRAMADADVGDDGYGEDPTVRELEERYAALVGKEAAVYVPSGTMANQIALRVLTRPGSAVVAGRRQHIVAYELGAGSLNAAVQFRTVDDTHGLLDPAEVHEAVDEAGYHQPTVGLICTEDTHMASGGAPWPEGALDELIDTVAVTSAAAHTAAAKGTGEAVPMPVHPVPLHVDGARLWNAAVATGTSPAARVARATTVMSCLSKGLCAPVGSLLAGPAPVIAEARVERKRLGGTMRQAGIIAAAGIVAITTMIDRLEDDHRRAAALGTVITERFPGAMCSAGPTNIIVFRPPDPTGLLKHLAAEGILAGMIAPGVVRCMTHHDVDDDGLAQAIRAVRSFPT